MTGVKEKRKVLFCVQLPPPVHGTSVMNQFLTQSRLLQDSFVLRVLPLQFNRSLKKIRTVSLKKMAIALVYAFRLVREMMQFAPDLVYYTLAPHGAAFYRDVMYTCIIKMFNKKILFHLHGEGIFGKARKNRLGRKLYQFVFHKNTPICLSESSSRDIREVFPGKPHIVHNGIPQTVSEGMLLDKKKRRKTRILFLSNLKPDKGIREFLQSLVLLKQKTLDFEAVIIGGETRQISFEDIRRFVSDAGLADRIEVKGPLYGQAKFRELIRSDILVLPTRNDNFPCVVLEAMESRLAVISSNRASIPEIIDHGRTGFIVEPGDISAIADHLQYFIFHPEEISRMGWEGRKKFLNHYTIEIFERNMKNLFSRELRE